MSVQHEAARAHGGPPFAELEALGLQPRAVIDFSVSTNPYGPAPAVLEAARRAALDVYPDPAATLARRCLARQLDVSPDGLALGNGAADLLWAVARTLVPPAGTVLIVEPTFSEFTAAARACGARVVEWRARPEDDFAIDLAAIAGRARSSRAQVIYLCAPNVPTGAAVAAGDIAALAVALPAAHIVLDQSFLSLSERFADVCLRLPANVVCVRSLTKEHALPGLRVGYLVATPALLARLDSQRPAWNTSAPAQAAVVAACEESRFVADSRTRLLADRTRLADALSRLGLPAVRSTTNFFLLPVGDAGGFRDRLLRRHRLLVRDCSSFGRPAHVRLGARPAADQQRLLAAVAQCLEAG